MQLVPSTRAQDHVNTRHLTNRNLNHAQLQLNRAQPQLNHAQLQPNNALSQYLIIVSTVAALTLVEKRIAQPGAKPASNVDRKITSP